MIYQRRYTTIEAWRAVENSPAPAWVTDNFALSDIPKGDFIVRGADGRAFHIPAGQFLQSWEHFNPSEMKQVHWLDPEQTRPPADMVLLYRYPSATDSLAHEYIIEPPESFIIPPRSEYIILAPSRQGNTVITLV